MSAEEGEQEEEFQADDAVAGEPESLHQVLGRLPLFDNLYLNMQAMNIGVTDLQLMDMEHDLLDLYIDREKTPLPETIIVSAWSQMWIFALYELLRTWRAQARELIEYGEQLAGAAEEERAALIERREEKLAKAASLTLDGAIHYARAFERVASEPAIVERLKQARELSEEVFRMVEMVRITLAKHEVPKSKGMIAQAPGYGRIGIEGSISWMVGLKDGSQAIVSRREVSDELRALAPALDRLEEAG